MVKLFKKLVLKLLTRFIVWATTKADVEFLTVWNYLGVIGLRFRKLQFQTAAHAPWITFLLSTISLDVKKKEWKKKYFYCTVKI